jgi:hypothetical protein
MNVNNISAKQAITVIALTFSGAVILAGFFASLPSKPATFTKYTAVFCAKQRVERMLKAPRTAEFAGLSDHNTMQVDESTINVTGYVDAQNSFGAMIRTAYSCEVTWNANTEGCSTDCQVSDG